MSNDIQPIVIQTAFAFDANKNRQIEPEEILKSFSELDSYDQDGDRRLKGKEFDGIYYELGKDVWAPAGKPYIEEKDNMIISYLLKEVDLKTGAIQMDINCTMLI